MTDDDVHSRKVESHRGAAQRPVLPGGNPIGLNKRCWQEYRA